VDGAAARIAALEAERMLLVEAIAAAEANFRAAFTGSPIGMCLSLAEDGTIIDANEAFLAALGLERRATLGRTSTELGLWGRDDRRAEIIGTLRARREAPPREVTLQRGDGTPATFLLSATLLEIAGTEHVLAWLADISALKGTERALRASEARWRSFVEQAPGVILVLDPDGTILFANRTLSGRLTTDVLGRPVFEFLPADPEMRVAERFARLVETREPVRFEHWAPGPGGERRWLDTRLAPVVGEAGEVRAVVSISIDITRRRETEAALRSSEARLRSIMENAPAIISVIDPDGSLLSTNRTVTGRATAENVGRPVFEMLPEEEVAGAREAFARAVGGRGTAGYAFSMVDGAGTRRRLEVSLAPVVVAGAVQSVVSVAVDVTDREAAERSRRESEQRFRDLVESMADWYWEMDAEGSLLESSPRGFESLGLAPGEHLGHTPLDFAAPDDAPRQREFVGGLMREPRPFSDFEGWYLHADGRRVCLAVSGVPVYGDGGRLRGYRGVARDVTARKQAERERLRMEAEVQQARRIESLGVLAGGIAHDFNNLLTAILGNTELALAELPAAAALRPLLEQVQAAGTHAAELTRQMLSYTGRGHTAPERIDLSASAREMGQLLASSVPKKVTLEFDLAEDLPEVEADPAQVRQVVMNLVLNAAEACDPAGGRVTVRTAAAGEAAPHPPDLCFGGLDAGRPGIVLEVADTGSGMRPETLARIFDPFFTTKFTGRGLGLAAVQGIILRQSGAIAVWSRPGAGSTFRVTFPAASAAAPLPGDARARDPASPWRGSGRVLLVDDEEPVRRLAERMLRALGFEVVCAADGREALEAFEAPGTPIRAVLLDLTMPRMDGREACRELHRRRPQLPVVLSSGYDVHEGADHAAGLPFSGYLQKPYRLADLARVLRAALGE